MSDDIPAEGASPAAEVKQPGLKFLEAAVYIMGGLLVLMLVGLIGGILWKAIRKAPVETATPLLVNIDVPAGAKVGQISINGDRAILQVIENGKDEVVVVDVKKGTVVARIRLKETAPAPAQ
jgi:hypothetical protein